MNPFPAEPSANSTTVISFLIEPMCIWVIDVVVVIGGEGGDSVISSMSLDSVVSSMSLD